jgi:hypothetical protein
MASTSASERTRSPSCFTRSATFAGLDTGRPPKSILPLPVAWTLAGRAGFAGSVAARFVLAWSTDFARAGVRSSRPASRSLASRSALTCRAMSSNGFGFALAVVTLDAASRPFLACCGPEADRLPLDLPAGFLGAPVDVPVVGVCRGLAMMGTPMPASRAGLSYRHGCRGPRAANNPTYGAVLEA